MNHFSLPPSEASTGGSLKDSLSSQVLFASPFSLPSLTTMQQIPSNQLQHQQLQPQQPQQNACLSDNLVSTSQLNNLQPRTSIQLPISNSTNANNLLNSNKTINSSDAEDWGSITTMLFTREFQRQQLQQQQQQQQYQPSQLSSHQTLYEPSQGHIVDINNSCPSPMLSAIQINRHNINNNTIVSQDQTKLKSKTTSLKPLNMLLENAINKALVNSYVQSKVSNSHKNSPISSRSPSTSRQPSISTRVITPKSKKEQQEIIKPAWNQGLNTPNRKSSTIATRTTAITTPSRKISEQNLKNITMKQQSALSKQSLGQNGTPLKLRERSSLSKENHNNYSPSGQGSSTRNSYQPSNQNHNHRHQNCKYPDGADSGGQKQQLKKEYQQKPFNLFGTCSSRKKNQEQIQLLTYPDENGREIDNSNIQNQTHHEEIEDSERKQTQKLTTSISVGKCSTPKQQVLQHQFLQTPNSDLLKRKISYCCLCANQISSDSQTKQIQQQQQPGKCIYEELCLYISNTEVRNFMYVSFAVSNTLVSGSWKMIPVSYFVSLVVEEYPEVLLDRQIGEDLLQELKTIMSRLLSSKENGKLMCLDKLESITKNTGLLGLILAALKLLTPAQSHEDSGMALSSVLREQAEQNTNRNQIIEKSSGIISKPKQTLQLRQLPVQLNQQLASRDSKNKLFEDQSGVISQQKQVATTLISLTDDSHLSNQLVLESKDIQNIFNLLQESCESLLIEMEHQVYSKFYCEMRRLTMKYKQTESLLRLVQSKVSDHYDVISESSFSDKKIKELEMKNITLNNQIRDYQSEQQNLQARLHNLSQQNQLLSKENEKMEERCSKYMEICLQSMQQLCENQGVLKNQLSDLVEGQRQNYQLSNMIEEKKRFLKEQLIFIKSESIRQSKEEIHRGNLIMDIQNQSSQQFAQKTTVSRKLTESLTVNDGLEETTGCLNRISIEIESTGNIHLHHEKSFPNMNPQIFQV